MVQKLQKTPVLDKIAFALMRFSRWLFFRTIPMIVSAFTIIYLPREKVNDLAGGDPLIAKVILLFEFILVFLLVSGLISFFDKKYFKEAFDAWPQRKR